MPGAQCGGVDDAQCLTTMERSSAGLQPGAPAPAAALPVGSAPAPPRARALVAAGDATSASHALSNTAIGLIAGVCVLALLVAGAHLLFLMRTPVFRPSIGVVAHAAVYRCSFFNWSAARY